MTAFSKLSTASELVSGMMTRLGTRTADRMEPSPERFAQSYRAMVIRCAGCSEHGACAKLQADNLLLDDAPSYCRNRETLLADR